MPRYGILVAVDGSIDSDAAIAWAAEEAAMRKQPVALMHVVAPVVVTWPVRYLEAGYRRWQDDHAELVVELAQKVVEAAVGDSKVTIQCEVRHGTVAAELVAASKRATMTVSGRRRLGALGAGLLGSVSRGLLHYARGPAAVIRPSEDAADRTLPALLGIYGSPASEAATAFAFGEASRRGAASNWWRCTRGATSAPSPRGARNGMPTNRRAVRSSPSACRVGSNSIRMCACGAGFSATGPRSG